MNTLELSEVLALKRQQLAGHGITITMRRDFGRLYELESVFEERRISRLFHPDMFDVFPENSFWLEGRNQIGETVHVQAAKLIDISDSSLGDVLSRHLARCFKVDAPIVECAPMNDLRGRCVYHGEMRLAPEFKHAGVGTLLTQIGILSASLEWRPDWICAFFEEWQTDRGFPVRSWYRNFEPVGRHWQTWIKPTELFGYISRRQITNLVALEVRGNEQVSPLP